MFSIFHYIFNLKDKIIFFAFACNAKSFAIVILALFSFSLLSLFLYGLPKVFYELFITFYLGSIWLISLDTLKSVSLKIVS